MLRILVIFFILGVCTSSFAQYSQNIDSLSKKEIRALLLQQDISPEASRLIEKHQNGRHTTYVFLGIAAAIIAVGVISGGNTEDPLVAAWTGWATIAGATLSLSTAAITGAVALARYDKAERLYLSKLNAQN